MDANDRHYCEKYLCDLACGACASRFMKATTRKKESIGHQVIDENCEKCADGKRIYKALGLKGVNDYRSRVNRVKSAAWKRLEDARMADLMEHVLL
jgi:hypothetical protein